MKTYAIISKDEQIMTINADSKEDVKEILREDEDWEFEFDTSMSKITIEER
jgi:hypothetical protein